MYVISIFNPHTTKKMSFSDGIFRRILEKSTIEINFPRKVNKSQYKHQSSEIVANPSPKFRKK